MHFARGIQTLLISVRIGPKVIHSNLKQAHRLGGSNRVSADGPLCIDLWKLWIAAHCYPRSREGRAWMNQMDRGGRVVLRESVARLVG